ncbi:RagB/SusD family nutrient uptake outer membrane protein [Sphingobacterium wenxiniae]|uniref:SusD family protein n=1 Tax=Sphingobacterium wenxiniae TaxID=683125 RepID=A0A1I6UA57_9SPHI|nr:RagB/SusD family nutrient uptake outer membrane protein [Sphingobacterium wenxiniae]SFS98284.1 SusD family protein [Sphingobacterium wenxiniae]
MKNKCIKGLTRFLPLFLTVLLTACSDFLDKKTSNAVAIPETVKDLRAMLDYESAINTFYPALAEMGSDDYYVPYAVLSTRSESEQLIYTWQRDEMRIDVASWTQPYHAIMICNVVLEALERGVEGNAAEKTIIAGEALFIRAFAYYFLAQVYCKPYDSAHSQNDLGLPLRTSSDMNDIYQRASVAETYTLIIEGLQEASRLLPETSSYKTRPTKAAAYGALARVYLCMQEYEEANQMAEAALQLYDELIDYNELDASANIPFEVFNKEVIYHGATTNGLLLSQSRARIPLDFFESYDNDDLRKHIFFNYTNLDNIIFKGYYAGRSSSYFAGIATDELYLIRAECEIRKGNVLKGLSFFNTLMSMRWKKDTYKPFNNITEEEALITILKERRKQLVKRGLRWSDLRRLNKDPRFAKTLIRVLDTEDGSKKYELPPDGVQYIYPIPNSIMEFNSYKQNPI